MQQRNSNIELLRIVIMFMILLLHTNAMSFGMPEDYSVKSFLRSFAEAFTLTPVNIFVLITGYFGTRFSLEKVGNLLYQVIFCVVPISLLLGWWYGKNIGLGYFDIFNYWFINAYLALLIIAPLLNAAIKSFSKNEFLRYMLIYYILIAFCGSFFDIKGINIDRGYSVVWFVFLYLIGRYVKIYPPRLSSSALLALILISCLGKTLFIFLTHSGLNYVDPFILVQSVCTLLLFTRFDFKSGVVNNIAKSTTMVYLINLHPFFWRVFKIHVNLIYDRSGNTFAFLSFLLLYCLAIFIFAILYDKIRLLTWGLFKPMFIKIDSWMQKGISLS